MMELINCERCGKLQVQRPDTMCLHCLQDYLADANTVKDYVKTHPGCTMVDVVRETGLPVKRVNEILER